MSESGPPSDSTHTVDLGDYYAILPMGGHYSIAEYCSKFSAQQVPEGFCYNSGSNPDFLSVAELRDLIDGEQKKAA